MIYDDPGVRIGSFVALEGMRMQYDRIVLSVHISVLCTRKMDWKIHITLTWHYLPQTFAPICATLALDSNRERLITLSRGSLLLLWLHILLDNYYELVNHPSHPQSRVLF
jgi:hypothetical protein